MYNIRNIENRRFDQSITFFVFEPMDKIICKDYIFSSGGCFVLFSRAEPVGQFVRGPYKKHLCDIILSLDQWLRMPFKDITYLQLLWPSCLA